MLEDKWQIFKKMLIGVISKGEAGQGREGSIGRQTDRRTWEACVCVTRWKGGTGREGERQPS